MGLETADQDASPIRTRRRGLKCPRRLPARVYVELDQLRRLPRKQPSMRKSLYTLVIVFFSKREAALIGARTLVYVCACVSVWAREDGREEDVRK